ncbi:hypothetical protein C8Q75DRAFT_807920 [Abortiporus biennis]|nr:hypothetical protein C8Q75DRAFT_807920 [Abortiporus biennis]
MSPEQLGFDSSVVRATGGEVVEVSRYFLIGRHRDSSSSHIGRGTRGYLAYDLKDKTLVFLKDAWRPASGEIWSEVKIYEILQEHDVEYVPTFMCGGDMDPPQRTVVQTWRPRFIHYRLITKQIGRPLCGHQDLNELTIAVYYAAWGAFSSLIAMTAIVLGGLPIFLFRLLVNHARPITGLIEILNQGNPH